ncbi:unnamed protein product [Cladocopium goreaui]|uniref:ADP-ribosylation factor n=1 Tax=Cladocopium goreaui TaxID=2562237 RepID=A0A9P1BN38_9DINO|nr:unnamed protein product [Cladocopium goreaui]
MALRRARRTRRTRIPEEQVQEGQWAMLNCWLSYGQMEGESFFMLYPEPQVAVQLAKLAGYEATVAYRDPQSQHALLKMRPELKTQALTEQAKGSFAPMIGQSGEKQPVRSLSKKLGKCIAKALPSKVSAESPLGTPSPKHVPWVV